MYSARKLTSSCVVLKWGHNQIEGSTIARLFMHALTSATLVETSSPASSGGAMLYELRSYDVHPEQWDAFLAWAERQAFPLHLDHFGFRLVGY
jgi:hypothetical protein